MVNRLSLLLLLVLSPLLSAQHKRIASDLRYDTGQHSWMGFVNHLPEIRTVTLTGYAADGTVLGTVDVELAAFGRYEVAANGLFENATPAWVGLDSEESVSGYVRYERQSDKSLAMVPLNHISVREAWVPTMADTEEQPASLTVVNTSAAEGDTILDPVRNAFWERKLKNVADAGATPLPQFSAAHQQAVFDYQSTLVPYNEGLLWDHVTSAVDITGVQWHHGVSSGQATMALAATPFRRMAIVPLHAAAYGYETGFVLVNTTTNHLDLDLTLYSEDGEPLASPMTLEPLQKITIPFGDRTIWPQHLFPTWYEVDTRETGLIGYQYSRKKSGGPMAMIEGGFEPAHVVALPYTPSNSTLRSKLTVINPGESTARYFLYGYGDDGSKQGFYDTGYLQAKTKFEKTTDELFGQAASSVTWVKILALRGQGAAYTLVSRRDGKAMAALQGQAREFARDERLIADFEFLRASYLLPQGWRGHLFSDLISRPQFPDYILNDGEEIPPDDGDFFTEEAFIADSGFQFLGYEPFLSSRSVHVEPIEDMVAYLSPYFEVPEYDTCYVSFSLRMLNPEWTTSASRYGLVWREEGTENWQWFGITGEILLDPPLLIADCWERVCYRDVDHEVTLTGWWPFETTLPEDLRGKRIQLGLFYDHRHTVGSPRQGPTPFLDNIRIATRPLNFSFFFEDASGEVFPSEDEPEPDQ